MRKLTMMYINRDILLVLIVVGLSGCQSMSFLNPTAGDATQGSVANKKLNYGVLSYEEGNYPAAITALQGVLDTKSSGKSEQVKAYKYLAFIHCISGREAICRDYFKKALEIDSSFILEPAEAGHPTWGPAFRSVKSKFIK